MAWQAPLKFVCRIEGPQAMALEPDDEALSSVLPQPQTDFVQTAGDQIGFLAPEAEIQIAMECAFKATMPFKSPATGPFGGNEGRWRAHLQVQQFDALGRPSGVTDASPVQEATRWGLGALLPGAGGKWYGLTQQDQQPVTLQFPLTLQAVYTSVRFAYTCILQDSPPDGFQLVSEPLFTDWFPIVLAPSRLEQLPYQAVGLIYAPPGCVPGYELSQERFAYSSLIATGTALADAEQEAYGYADFSSSGLVTAQTAEGGTGSALSALLGEAGGGSIPFGISLAIDETQSQGWSTQTKTVQTRAAEDGVTFKTEAIDSTAYALSVAGAEPGDQAPPANQPFWADLFVLMVKAQYAIWDYPSFKAQQLLGAYPSYQLASVRQLQLAAALGSSLTSALAEGESGIGSLAVQALTGPIAAGETVYVGTGRTAQALTASAAAQPGETVIQVQAFTSAYAQPVGAPVYAAASLIAYVVPDGAGGTVPILSLAPPDAEALLGLDPFYEAGWQGAPVDASDRFRLIGATEFGTRVVLNDAKVAVSDAHVQTTLEEILRREREDHQRSSTSIEYESECTLEQVKTTKAGVKINLGVVQFGQSSERKTRQGETQTSRYSFTQSTLSLQETQSALTVTGVLDDGPLQATGKAKPQGFLQVVVYRDLALGGIAFQDINAVKPQAPPAAPKTPVARTAGAGTKAGALRDG